MLLAGDVVDKSRVAPSYETTEVSGVFQFVSYMLKFLGFVFVDSVLLRFLPMQIVCLRCDLGAIVRSCLLIRRRRFYVFILCFLILFFSVQFQRSP